MSVPVEEISVSREGREGKDFSLRTSRASRNNLVLSFALPLIVAAIFLAVWHALVKLSGSDIFPTPLEVLRGIGQLIEKGLLLKYVAASEKYQIGRENV